MQITPLTIDKTTAVIHLTKGKFALIDIEDWDKVSQRRWWFWGGYALGKQKSTKIRLHRFLTDAPQGMEVDHANGNTLDNRRANLRVCTKSENQRNKKKSPGTSKFKGVHWIESRKRWRAQIGKKGKRGSGTGLGDFKDEIEAALAYDRAAIEHYGEFARLNFAKG